MADKNYIRCSTCLPVAGAMILSGQDWRTGTEYELNISGLLWGYEQWKPVQKALRVWEVLVRIQSYEKNVPRADV